jgi:hypothetical protein
VATREQVEAWVEQAEADLQAASVASSSLRECHRRYWLQQSYEKSIKAYALMRWRGDAADEREFTKVFLLQHSPLKSMSDVSTPLSRAMYLLRREVEAFVRSLDNDSLLMQIDATTPRNDPAEVSYRYPFLLRDGSYVPPASFEGWDDYQGNEKDARAAVTKLLRAVKGELRTFARAPR